MAEAHNAAALSFSITHDGISVSYDQELLRDIWHAFSHGYRRRMARWKNDFRAGTFPASPFSLVLTAVLIIGLYLLGLDLTLGSTRFLRLYVFYYLFGDGIMAHAFGLVFATIFVWFLGIQLLRVSLKMLLNYKGWMYEGAGEGKVSSVTKFWLAFLHLISRCGPLMHSFQGSLPHLPLPPLADTLSRHLRSMRPILDDQEYEKLKEMSDEFENGLGKRLQRYLWLKSWLSINYITDWWEEFVYLRQRSPIMINSNYYALDAFNPMASKKQSARAGNCVYAALLFRRMIDRCEISPFSVSPRFKVPFCTMQYERLLDTTRIPGEESDSIQKTEHTRHIAVLHKGVWYRVKIHTGKRLVRPAELQAAFEKIINSNDTPSEAESRLPVLTAGERVEWAKARKQYFSRGLNKTSLHTIERAAFVLVLDDIAPDYDESDYTKLDEWACIALHGNGYDRWYDKSVNIIVSRNGRVYFNVEHSWGDAAVAAHFFEYILYTDSMVLGYDKDNCKGESEIVVDPQRLQWEIQPDCVAVLDKQYTIAKALIDDVEMALMPWNEFGKGFIKKTRMSPDAFLQMALQLTYRKNQQRSCLTYEASMTRLFREGRTETVRSCSIESKAFVDAMLDSNTTIAERQQLLRAACDRHQNLYRDAMVGKGVDRHIFALYVVMRYLEEKSPFLEKIMPPIYELSTSQTPMQQTPGVNLIRTPWMASAGGGFGPVSEKGYGVSYIVVGDHLITFHISSKRSAPNSSSVGFRTDLASSLRDMRALFPEIKTQVVPIGQAPPDQSASSPSLKTVDSFAAQEG